MRFVVVWRDHWTCWFLRNSVTLSLFFFSYASSSHNGAKPLCNFGLTNPRALLFQKTKAGGRAPSHHGVCLRWDCCILWASSSIRRWLYTITVPGDDRRLFMEVRALCLILLHREHYSAQQGGSEGQLRQLIFLQHFWPYAQRGNEGAKWLQPGFCPLCGQRQQRGLFPLKSSWFLHKRLQENLKNGTRSLGLKIPSLWGTRSCQITNEETLSPNQTGVAGVLPFSFQADDLYYMG